MMKDTLTKHYPYLTGPERFQLVLKATAEDNESETERLVKTCPKKDYRMHEAAFLDRIEAAMTLTAAFVNDLAEQHGRLQLVMAFEEFLPWFVEKISYQAFIGMDKSYEDGFTRGWQVAGGKGEPPDMADQAKSTGEVFTQRDHYLQMFVKIRRPLQEQVKAMWEAFALVCREDMRLEPETLLAAFCPTALEWIKGDFTEDTVADEDIKGKFLKLMRGYWQKRIRD